jgi:hypothetical protein
MAIPSYGAAPLSATFLGIRVMQAVSLIVILGLTANFINSMVMANREPSKEIVATVVIVCLSISAASQSTNSSRRLLSLCTHCSAWPTTGLWQTWVSSSWPEPTSSCSGLGSPSQLLLESLLLLSTATLPRQLLLETSFPLSLPSSISPALRFLSACGVALAKATASKPRPFGASALL